ncbi:hypothetical protein [Saccharopolyspora sp. CA-218241]|uniref:hypothetical protein n=1 Tax=Saccharopolyspora sp. CA-218241 TaxID=3240027 RepID=UPI003D951223
MTTPGPPQQYPPVVLDLGGRAAAQILVGGALAGGIGLLALGGVVFGGTGGDTVGLVIGSTIGLVFLGIGLLCLLGWRRATRPRHLLFEPEGIRCSDPGGTSWAVRWEELSAVTISRTQERAVQLSDHLTRRTLVRLDLHPADPAFRQRHPEMDALLAAHPQRQAYRYGLGHAADWIPHIERGVRQYRPQLFQGVRDEGFTVGLS